MRGPAVLLAMLLFGPPLHAQSLEPGTPLRVHANGYTVKGDLVRWTADSLVVQPHATMQAPGPRSDRAIAVSDIQGLERNAPRPRGWGAARGALWGGVIGGVLGGVAMAASNCYEDEESLLCPGSRAEGAFAGAAVLGVFSAGVGALIGAAFPGKRWEEVEYRN